MGKKMLAAALLMCTIAVGAKAQDSDEEETTKPIFIAIDFGATAFTSDFNEQPYIRSYGHDYYYDDNATSTVYTQSSKLLAGVKAEFYLTKHISVASGIRFVQFNKKVNANGFWDWHDDDFFYFAAINRKEAMISDCFRMEKLSQKIYCLGIPLEFKFSPTRPTKGARFYMKLAGDVSKRLGDRVDSYFKDDRMKRYSKEVENTLNETADYFASGYAAFGFEFGHIDTPRFSFEFQLPAFATNDSDSFLESNVGIGVQFNLAFPVR